MKEPTQATPSAQAEPLAALAFGSINRRPDPTALPSVTQAWQGAESSIGGRLCLVSRGTADILVVMTVLLIAFLFLCAGLAGISYFLGFKKLGMTFLIFTGLGGLANLALFVAIASSKM